MGCIFQRTLVAGPDQVTGTSSHSVVQGGRTHPREGNIKKKKNQSTKTWMNLPKFVVPFFGVSFLKKAFLLVYNVLDHTKIK